MTLGACQYCGHCEYFGCESNPKASPNICIMPVLMAGPAIRAAHPCLCEEPRLRPAAKKVRGVTYIDRDSGEEIEQPADLVVLCAYPFNNVTCC